MFTEKTVNGFVVGESDVKAMNGTTAVVSDAIVHNLGGAKVPVAVNVTIAGGADAAPLQYQVSLDGTNWSAGVEIDASIVATATGVKTFIADLTGVQAPYFRLVMAGVGSLGTTGRFKFLYAAPSEYLRR